MQWWRAVKSVLAAMLGVQNQKNREHDFKHGNPLIFVILGVVFTALFVGTLLLVIQQVLK
ncbi:MAG: DUF2970 domain-containing protein [Legionellales bacterium]|nr:DUF2970 domain-containing protein [Legionellales bacterium]|tara:strand:+ start:993 stop:1172 length:180 start_codon:yes stop_codon:yes gene_type:complete